MEKRGCCLFRSRVSKEHPKPDLRFVELLPKESDWVSIYSLICWLDRNKSTFLYTDPSGVQISSQHNTINTNWLGSSTQAREQSLFVLEPDKYLLSGVEDTSVGVSFKRIDEGPVDIVTFVYKKSRKGPNVFCNWSGYRLFPFGEARNSEVEKNTSYNIALSTEDMDNKMEHAIDKAYRFTLSYLLNESLQETPSNIIPFGDKNKF